ncbi:MAG: hypothetical protein GY749_14130 [Desulfobacteraceae bacterium]|nr:hypothetical protein [Desulfobacteraceae bacterium]
MDAVETTITEHIFNQGVIKGEAKARREIVINLLKMGMDTNFITRATGLSEEGAFPKCRFEHVKITQLPGFRVKIR